MTEEELYKFVQNKEMQWRKNKLLLWIESNDAKDFVDLLGHSYISESGLERDLLADGLIAIEMNKVCSDFGIEVVNIFPKEF